MSNNRDIQCLDNNEIDSLFHEVRKDGYYRVVMNDGREGVMFSNRGRIYDKHSVYVHPYYVKEVKDIVTNWMLIEELEL